MFRYFFIIFFFVRFAFADDLFNILDSKTDLKDLNIGKKVQALEKLVKKPTVHQSTFFQLMAHGEVKKAFYHWPVAFGKTSFAESDNGRALYSYLLFKNDLILAGLETLFAGKRKRVDPLLIQLWQSLMQVNIKVWKLTDIQWSEDWVDVFGLPAGIRVMARRFDNQYTLVEFEDLLRKTSPDSWERHWIQWRYITALLIGGEDIKAAKLLKYLQETKRRDDFISMDLMNLTAARMLYQNTYLTESIRYYKKVKKGSDYWFEALEEIGWAELRMRRPQNALAYTQTLFNPNFRSDLGPGAFYLSSLSSLRICDYEGVSRTILEFKNYFRSKTKELLNLKKHPETPAVKELLVQLSKKRINNSDLGHFAGNLPRHIAHDESLYFLLQRQNQLKVEVKLAEKLYSRFPRGGIMKAGFQKEMEKFRDGITKRSQEGYVAVLNRVKALASQEIMEISKILKKMQIVEAELIQQLSVLEEDKSKLDSVKKGAKAQEKRGTTGSDKKYSMHFIHKGEKWFDELSNYRVNVKKGCIQEGTM